MTCRRLVAVLLVLGLALVPPRAAAQAPPAAPVALAALFPADTVGYLEVQLQPGGDQGPRLERLLRLLTEAALSEEQWAWLRLVPRLARALAVGVWLRGEEIGGVGVVAADDPRALLSLLGRAREGAPSPTEVYGDIPIYRMSRGGAFYLAAVHGYLVAAADRDALVATIDRVRAGAAAGPGLAAAPRYQAAAGRLPATRCATGYLDGAGLAGWLDRRRVPARRDERRAAAWGRPAGPADGDAAPRHGVPRAAWRPGRAPARA
jgi:hypothetical protein